MLTDSTTHPEPGLLDTFRFYVGFRVFISVIYILIAPYIIGHPVPPESGLMLSIAITSGLILLLLLSLSWLQRLLGRYFLQTTFIYAALDALFIEKLLGRSLLGKSIFFNESLQTSSAPVALDGLQNALPILAGIEPEMVRVSTPLFVLLVLLAWQYRFSWVLIYTLITAVVDMLYVLTFPTINDAQLIYIVVGIVLRTVAMILIGYIITRLMTNQRQQRQQLTDANNRLTAYAAMTEQLATSRERNRLARELHDTLAHTLSAASVQLEAVNSLWEPAPDKAHAQLQRALKTTRDGLQETRRALHALRAAPLEDLGLLFALRELADLTRERSGSTVHVVLPDALPALRVEVEQTLYRTAQEALENAVRHAQSQHITLAMSQQDDRLCLEVTDDGRGFDPANLPAEGHHYGIRGMQERVAALGGVLRIDSTPGSGTRIGLEVAL